MSSKRSRINKFEKRRKNTKAISILLIIGSILLLLFLSLLFWNSEDNESVIQSESENKTEENTQKEEDNSIADTEDDNSEESNNKNEEIVEEVDLVKEQVKPSDDNVIEAYIANWKPIGTQQSEPHTTNYNDGSEDRKEIDRAISSVTDLDENNMVTLWIGNDGEQRVIGTVSNREQTEFYRVYLNWVEEQGWRPTKVEILKENDINQ